MKLNLAVGLMAGSLFVLGYLAYGLSSGSGVLEPIPNGNAGALSPAILRPKLPVEWGPDPFRVNAPIASVANAGGGIAPLDGAPQVLEAIMLSEGFRGAVIDGHIRVEGSDWLTSAGTASLKQLGVSQVTVELAGQEIVLKLSAASAKSTASDSVSPRRRVP